MSGHLTCDGGARLNAAQAFTRTIKDKGRCGVKVQADTRARVKLTPSGQEFYDLADRMVALDNEVSERLEGFNAMQQVRLTNIGSAPQPVLRTIARFRQRFPDVRIDFGLYDWTTATALIKGRLADVGRITDAPEHDFWERIHIERSRYILYCRADHPLARRTSVSLRDLVHETLIVPEKGSLTQSLLGQTCRKHDMELRRIVTMTTFPLMCEAVLQDTGVALFLGNSSLNTDTLVQVPVHDMQEQQETYLIATKDSMRLQLVADFINAAMA
ncbi:MAG: substrate-binding domain-containing protein [Pseudomonadota bacterium]